MSADVNDINITGQSSQPQPVAPAQPTAGEEMVNKPTIVKAFGREYAIKRFSMAQVFSSVEFIAPFGFVLQSILALPREEYRDANGKVQHRLVVTDEQKAQFAVTALSISGPSCLGLISVATNEPIEWLQMGDKDPFDGLEILSEVLGRNLDFFTPENMAKVNRLIERLTGAVVAFSGKT